MFTVEFFSKDYNDAVYFDTEEEAKKAEDYINASCDFTAYHFPAEATNFDTFKKYFDEKYGFENN